MLVQHYETQRAVREEDEQKNDKEINNDEQQNNNEEANDESRQNEDEDGGQNENLEQRNEDVDERNSGDTVANRTRRGKKRRRQNIVYRRYETRNSHK